MLEPDYPWLLCDSETADWAELSPEGAVYEMDDSRRTPFREWTRLVQYAYKGENATVLDVTTPEGQKGLETLKRLADAGTTFVIHNALYDLPRLWKLGVYPKQLFDTLTASQMIWCGSMLHRHNLEEVIERETGLNPYTEIVKSAATLASDKLVDTLAKVSTAKTQEEKEAHFNALISQGKKILQKSNWGRETLTQAQLDYAAADVGTEYAQTFKSLLRQLHDLALVDQFTLEMQILPIIAQMSVDGMKYDMDKWKSYIGEQKAKDEQMQELLITQLDLWNQALFPEDYLITLRRKAPDAGKPEVWSREIWSKPKPAKYSKKTGQLIRAEQPSEMLEPARLLRPAVPAQVVGELFKIQPRPAYVPYKEIIPALTAQEQGDVRIGGPVRIELGVDPGESVSITKPMHLRKVFNALLNIEGEGFDEDEVTSLIGLAEKAGLNEEAAWLKTYQEEAKLRKLVSTYGESFWQFADEAGYIHARFSTTEADTNRVQASEPNVLNMPRPMQKKLWCVEEGHAMIKADYSGQEGRLLFYLGEQWDVYDKLTTKGMDLHSMTLSLKKNVPYDQLVIKTPGKKDKIKPELDDERTGAKAATFAPCFGAKAKKMSETLGISYVAGKKFVDNYWKTYDKVKKMQDMQVYKAVHLGYVTDLSFGRKRFFFKSKKEEELVNLGRSWEDATYGRVNPAMNFAAQASGATILRFALLRVTQMIKDHPEWEAVIRLTVHDAMVLSCKAEFGEECGKELGRQMEIAATEVVPGITIPVDVDVYYDRTAPSRFTEEAK